MDNKERRISDNAPMSGVSHIVSIYLDPLFVASGTLELILLAGSMFHIKSGLYVVIMREGIWKHLFVCILLIS